MPDLQSRAAALEQSWRQKLDQIVVSMREMSQQTDPQAMVQAYGQRTKDLFPRDGLLSLSRRELESPAFRITRFSEWTEPINPWKEKERLPLLHGGLLGELLYGEEPRIIDDLQLDPHDPAYPYLKNYRCLAAIPMFDHGQANNMTIMLWHDPRAFSHEDFPELVWMTSLFGRATHNLVLADQVRAAYNLVDREMQIVADIQRSLLPAQLPKVRGLDLAASYQTSSRAGGDYYDFFPLADGKCGILIADVSGHGTPAAVIMAITHGIAHALPGPPTPPGRLLDHLNHHLASRYTVDSGAFVTAFYGIYDPDERELVYACAGHNPPRVRCCRSGLVSSLDGAGGLPLGITTEAKSYPECRRKFSSGDLITFYTDGITEAQNPADELFGLERLDAALQNCRANAEDLIQSVLNSVTAFAAGRPALDDQTLLVARVT